MITLDDFRYYIDTIENDLSIDGQSESPRALVHLLSNIFDDDSEWIRYYITQLDFGRNYVEGEFPKMSNVDELYEFLLRQHYESPKKHNSKLFR